MKINTVVPVITVHPISAKFDRKIILNHKLIAPKSVIAQRDRLFQVVKKYVQPEDYDNLLNDLAAFIQNETEEITPEGHLENDLKSILDGSRIHIFESSCSWQSSIRSTGQCLIDYRSIEKRYLDMIINQISMAVFREPVVYSGLRKAKLVFVLASAQRRYISWTSICTVLLAG